MKIKMYIDLPNDTISSEYAVYATTKPSSQKFDGWSRYLVEVDLPIHHFRPIADRKVEAVLIGKEEE